MSDDQVELPKGTIIISVPSTEKGLELLETFHNGGASSAVLGETEDGEIVVAVEPGEFFALQGMTDGENTIEITQEVGAAPTKRGKA